MVEKEIELMNDITLEKVSKSYLVPIRSGKPFKDLVKRQYQKIDAVRNISMEIAHGEAVGMIGPNGAGKSTTLKMLTGILVPDSGSITVFGKDPFAQRKRNCSNIGVLFGQKSQLWWDLPAKDTFVLLKKIYKIPDQIFEKNMEKYTDVLDVSRYIDQPVRQLSLGQRMRLELMASLLHNPRILFLDEPTLGLDVAVKRQIRELLQMLKGETTIILTSHDMKDIDTVCERLVVIDKGSIVIDDAIEQVKKTYGNMEKIEIKLKETDGEVIRFLPPEVHAQIEENTIICNYDVNRIHSADILQCVLKHCSILDVSIMSADIDDIIEKIYQGSN